MLKNNTNQGAEDVDQLVECLPSKHKALGSMCSTNKPEWWCAPVEAGESLI